MPRYNSKYFSALFVCLLLFPGVSFCADIELRLKDNSISGSLICLLYKSPNSFGDLSNPYQKRIFNAEPGKIYLLSGLPAGTYALAVFLDENNNGFLDKNFIGIPREPISFSNQYKPKGPPVFSRAQFFLKEDEPRREIHTLRPVLGRYGRLGLGWGIISRSSPYRGYSANVYQFIPAVTYLGERIQILGPKLSVGIFGSNENRLAATLSYRMGVYEEDDSSFLKGMGDRRDTAMLGLALEAELFAGLEADLGYQHDFLDRIGGGSAELSVEKSFQFGPVRISPTLGLNWLSSNLSNYDYGVALSRSSSKRPAYAPGAIIDPEIGLKIFVELSRDWLISASLSAEYLDEDVQQSPIVNENHLLKGFLTVGYVF